MTLLWQPNLGKKNKIAIIRSYAKYLRNLCSDDILGVTEFTNAEYS